MEKLSVLVIEDVEADALLLQRALSPKVELQGWSCVATPGELDHALKSRHWDVVLCDWSLPGFGGEQALARTHEHDPYLPVVVVTGALDDADAPQIFTHGAADYLQKDRLARLPTAVVDAVRRARARRLVDLQGRVLLDIARGIPLAESMGTLLTALDRMLPGVCSTLVCLDEAGKYVVDVIAPGMARADRAMLFGAAAADVQAGWTRPLHGECGRTTGILLLQPVTDDRTPPPDEELLDAASRLAELALQRFHDEGMQRLASETLDNMGEGVVVMDHDMRVTWVNAAFNDISGMSREFIIGRVPPFVERERETTRQVLEALERDGKWQGELLLSRADGSMFPALVTVSTITDESGTIRKYVAVFNDISAMRDYERRLDYLVHHDPLTQLPNRSTLHKRLSESLERARRFSHSVALIHLDLDHFRTINDSLGQEAGDRILKSAAARLRDCVRDSDTIGRFGDDEFGVVIDQFQAPEECMDAVERILETLRRPYLHDGHELYAPASAGIACYPQDGENVALLVRNADIAMHRTKEHQRGGFEFFSSEMSERAYDHLVLLSALRGAAERGELFLEYQPRVVLDGDRIASLEALVRWRHPERGLVSPAEFIPLAEESGVIVGIGHWVLIEACRQAAAWREKFPNLRIAVNLSAHQLMHEGLVTEVSRILLEQGLPPHALELELTESVLMGDPDGAQAVLEALTDLGVTLAIDDFGTGYSSLSYLKRVPARQLKIDRSFIRGLPGEEDDVELVRTIIAVARNMGLGVTAEGVEEEAQLEFLREAGCDEYQGYLFSRPLPADRLDAFLGERYHDFTGTITDRVRSFFKREEK